MFCCFGLLLWLDFRCLGWGLRVGVVLVEVDGSQVIESSLAGSLQANKTPFLPRLVQQKNEWCSFLPAAHLAKTRTCHFSCFQMPPCTAAALLKLEPAVLPVVVHRPMIGRHPASVLQSTTRKKLSKGAYRGALDLRSMGLGLAAKRVRYQGHVRRSGTTTARRLRQSAATSGPKISASAISMRAEKMRTLLPCDSGLRPPQIFSRVPFRLRQYISNLVSVAPGLRPQPTLQIDAVRIHPVRTGYSGIHAVL